MHYHIVGVGGAGMSAIAHLLLDQGHQVSGCDMQRNRLTAELMARGATIHQGHAADHRAAVDVVVTSSALKADQPELMAAVALGLPVEKRADLWRGWSLAKPTLAIAGTHGKTTTTAIAALLLRHLQVDPAFIVPAGGPVPGLDRFAKWGRGPLVIEADEYDRVFLGLLPQVAVITSVDWDHVDIYPTRAASEAAFRQFAAQTTGTVVICSDEPGAARLAAALTAADPARVVPYGLVPNAGWRAEALQVVGDQTAFTVRYAAEPDLRLAAQLAVPGDHNVQNALGAAVGVWVLLGRTVPMATILAELVHYQGAARRFEFKGEAGGVTVIDDYAHNPPKIRAALQAARARYGDRRLVVYVQPHTFSRTQALAAEFAYAFAAADQVLIGDIYPSRERQADFPAITATWLADRIVGPTASAVGSVDDAAVALSTLVRPGDVVLTLGAGDGYLVGERLLAARTAQPVVA